MASNNFLNLLSVRESVSGALRSYFRSSSVLEVPVPVIVGITGACENVSTLFRVGDERRLHLTQTGQLALEHALCAAKGVYCITSSFRTDLVDERHLHEFTLIEEEISCDHPIVGIPVTAYDSEKMFDALLCRITDTVKVAIRACVEEVPEAVASLGGDIGYLSEIIGQNFNRITYTTAIDMLNSDGALSIPWGSDLHAEHELLVIELLSRETGGLPLPTFMTHYPKDIKFFNMKVDDQISDVVQSADLILPHAGETVGSAVREHRYELLLDRLASSTMFAHIKELQLATLDDFSAYLDVVREQRTSPHAGYGLGLERLLQFLTRNPDVRSASSTYRLSEMMGFASVLTQSQPGSSSPGF